MRTQHEHAYGRGSDTTAGGKPGADPARARGSAVNPPSRFEKISLDQLPEGGGSDDLIWEEAFQNGEPARRLATQVYRDNSRTVINPVDSPDLNFSWTLNPYRGCEHGCVYCYARPTHEYLGLSCGLDFETRIFAKLDAPELLRAELSRPSWRGAPIMMSGITDCYQPLERRLRITRGCLEVMAECGQPVTIVTKSALVLRDIDLLASLAQRRAVSVAISLTTLDSSLSSTMEPRASSPQQRLRAMRELNAAGIPVGVMTAPIIPGINDRELPALLQAAARAGAKRAGYVLLRLPWQNKAIFLDWIKRSFPERAAHIESLIRQQRDGKLYDAGWGKRFRGEGPIADQIEKAFKVFARRYGFNEPRPPLSSAAFIRPDRTDDPAQFRLFG